jgi:hypothetical protein
VQKQTARQVGGPFNIGERNADEAAADALGERPAILVAVALERPVAN